MVEAQSAQARLLPKDRGITLRTTGPICVPDPPITWRFGTSVRNGHTTIGVVTAGNLVARAFNGRGIVEVNRLCFRRDILRALAWSAASMLYGWSAREAQRQGFTRIITYTTADEDSTSVKAAGWKQEAAVRGRGGHSYRRDRSNRNGWIDKIRWGKSLRPKRSNPTRKDASHAYTPSRHDCWNEVFMRNRDACGHIGLGLPNSL